MFALLSKKILYQGLSYDSAEISDLTVSKSEYVFLSQMMILLRLFKIILREISSFFGNFFKKNLLKWEKYHKA